MHSCSGHTPKGGHTMLHYTSMHPAACAKSTAAVILAYLSLHQIQFVVPLTNMLVVVNGWEDR